MTAESIFPSVEANLAGAATYTWRRYPEYRATGLDWLGEVPSHWRLKPLKRVVLSPVERGFRRELPFIALEHIASGEGRPVREFEWDTKPADEYAVFQPGDVLFGKLRPYLRKFFLADRIGCCPTELLVFRPLGEDCLPGYLFYLVQAAPVVSLTVAASYGTKMPRTSWEILGPSYVWLPPRSEQQAIADFLDRETAKLDSLIERKEHLIELLEEQRTALVSRVVTEGLDPSAPTNDHGLEWLDEIPAHWQPTRLRFTIRGGTQNGLYKPQDYYGEGGTPIISMAEAFSSPVIRTSAKDRVHLTAAEYQTYELEQGDLLFARRSLVFEGSGRCSMVGAIPEPHVFESSIIRVRPNADVLDPTFASLYLNSTPSRFQILRATKQVTISGIDADSVKDILLFLPPLQEQHAIVAHLNREVEKSERLISKIRA